jgi:hypothetical protein
VGTSLDVSPLARKQFDLLGDEAKSAYVKALKHLATIPSGDSMTGLRHLFEHQAKQVGATYQLRASKALRILLNRHGTRWEVVRFMKRGEKLLWSSER